MTTGGIAFDRVARERSAAVQATLCPTCCPMGRDHGRIMRESGKVCVACNGLGIVPLPEGSDVKWFTIGHRLT